MVHGADVVALGAGPKRAGTDVPDDRGRAVIGAFPLDAGASLTTADGVPFGGAEVPSLNWHE